MCTSQQHTALNGERPPSCPEPRKQHLDAEVWQTSLWLCGEWLKCCSRSMKSSLHLPSRYLGHDSKEEAAAWERRSEGERSEEESTLE